MTVVPDREWESLSVVWRTSPDPVDAGWVRELVDRHTRRLRLVVAIEALITVAAVIMAVAVMVSGRTAAAIGWGLGALAHTLVVAGFTAWNRAGVWRPMSEATRDYLRLARERCLRQRRAAWVLGGFVVVEGAGLAIWAIMTETELPRTTWQLVIGLAVVGPLVWSIWSGRSAGLRLVRLGGIEQALARVG
jgi:hypothetical protein